VWSWFFCGFLFFSLTFVARILAPPSLLAGFVYHRLFFLPFLGVFAKREGRSASPSHPFFNLFALSSQCSRGRVFGFVFFFFFLHSGASGERESVCVQT